MRLPFHPAAIQALRNAGGMWNARLGVWLFSVSRYSHTIFKGCLPDATRWYERTSVSDRLPELVAHMQEIELAQLTADDMNTLNIDYAVVKGYSRSYIKSNHQRAQALLSGRSASQCTA